MWKKYFSSFVTHWEMIVGENIFQILSSKKAKTTSNLSPLLITPYMQNRVEHGLPAFLHLTFSWIPSKEHFRIKIIFTCVTGVPALMDELPYPGCHIYSSESGARQAMSAADRTRDYWWITSCGTHFHFAVINMDHVLNAANPSISARQSNWTKLNTSEFQTTFVSTEMSNPNSNMTFAALIISVLPAEPHRIRFVNCPRFRD